MTTMEVSCAQTEMPLFMFWGKRMKVSVAESEDRIVLQLVSLISFNADLLKRLLSEHYLCYDPRCFHIFFVWHCAACQIGALSWGNSDITRYTGYIALNSKKVISTLTVHDWGFILVELNVSSCSALKAQVYNTFSSSTNGSENMAYYIKGLPLYTVLIGITSYDPYLSLTQNAKSALIAIGANLTGMQRESKLCFVAQIGQPAMSVSKMASPGGFNLNITVNVAGI